MVRSALSVDVASKPAVITTYTIPILFIQQIEEDNMVNPLRATEYMNSRLFPELNKRLDQAPGLSRTLGIVQVSIFGCTAASACLSALELHKNTIVVLAFSAACTSGK